MHRGIGTSQALRSLAIAGLTLAAAGCGDNVSCPSEVVVVIGSYADGDTLTGDTSPAPGMQIDVPVRSNLRTGDGVALIVLDAGGAEVNRVETTSNASGDAMFQDVDVPPGEITLRVVGTSAACGEAMDEVRVTVIGDADCELVIREGPLASDFYFPLGVLSSLNDSDPVLPGFQAHLDIVSRPGYLVELFVMDLASAMETSAGVQTAGTDGMTTFPITLAQGRQALRAACVSTSSGARHASGTTAVFVDTEVPICDLVSPASGTTIIPDMDVDGDPDNGTQILLTAMVDARGQDDVAGELAVFTINGVEHDAGELDASGVSTLLATFDSEGAHELAFRTQDHAGNACSVERVHEYVTDGCGIALLSPLGPVTGDANGEPADGVQVEIVVQVGEECVGQTVTTDCGLGMTSGVVPAGGVAALEVTVCEAARCEITQMCTVRVTSTAGITTAVGTTLVVDNLPPNVSLQFVDPVTSCGSAVTPAVDLDGDPDNGVQIDVRVVSPLATARSVVVTSSDGTVEIPAGVGGDTRITLGPGANDIVAAAEDPYGNRGETGPCHLSLDDLVVTFDPPIADGLVGSGDGVAGAGELTLDVCGAVSEPNASVEVSINGGAPAAATVNGTSWCLPGVTLAESPPAHVIEARATLDALAGTGTLLLTVDLTPPPPVDALAVIAPTRQSVELSWSAPDDGGLAAHAYVIKMATVPLTPENFDVTGSVIAGPAPGAPGAAEALLVEQLLAGQGYYLGVASVDAAGNRSSPEIVGPVSPDLDGTGAIGPIDPDSGDNFLGYQVARGDFNGDGYGDVAVAAPYKRVGASDGVGAVYVYFGGPDGLGSPVQPDVILEGADPGGQFGNGLTAIRWSGGAAHDLAVGAPFADNHNGRVYVFHGGAAFGGTLGPADADVVIGGAGGWFDFGLLGYSLAAARFDSDGVDDLVIGVLGGGNGNGGVAVVYGGSGESSIMLSDLDPSGSGSAHTLVIQDPDATEYDLFGHWVFNLGRTQGPGDTRDDIGVAYFDGGSVYVLRGRQRPPAAGVTLAGVDLATDLRVVNDSTDTTNVFFGSAMGSIADLDGDGARDIVIGSWAEGTYNGRVVIVDGDAVGTQPIAGISITTINPAPGVRKLGTAVLNNATALGGADVNNDGLEDLLIVGGSGGTPVSVRLFVWYGGSVPIGTTTTASAHHEVPAPASFTATIPPSGGTPMVAIWAGDVNDDGLEDICWADSMASGRDGAFELLWDDGM